MGFLNAVLGLGMGELRNSNNGELADVSSFTQMPADIVEDSGDEKAKRLPAQEIHVTLDVVDPQARPVEILGIKEIGLALRRSGVIPRSIS